MYRYFTTRFGNNVLDAFDELKKEFPECKFSKGNRKGQHGIWVIYDLEFTGKYAEAWETEKGDWFQGPENIQLIRNNLKQFKTVKEERVPIRLKCGIELEIFPASAIPKKALFSRKIRDNSDEIYNAAHPYGAAAYSLYFRAMKKEVVYLDDPEYTSFVQTALKESYTLPIEMWDALEIVTLADFDMIFAAAMGIPTTELEKKTS